MHLSLRCHTLGRTIRSVLPSQTILQAVGAAHEGENDRGADERGESERGGLSLMLVILFVALAGLAGIVVDGGAKLTADENAVALAQEAARAGATTVDQSAAYASGSFVVSQQQALAAARSYLIGAGYDRYSVAADGSRAIRVSVTITEPTRFLSLIGMDSFTCTGSATASLVTGVTGAAG
jgi:hypothetical protein